MKTRYIIIITTLIFMIFNCNRSEIPIVYTIDFGMYEKFENISNFNVSLESESLNPLNKEVELDISFNVDLDINKKYHSAISSLHMSDRFIFDNTLPYERIIELTPVLQSDVKKSKQKESLSLKKIIKIKSHKWGMNKILIVCGNAHQVINFSQKK